MEKKGKRSVGEEEKERRIADTRRRTVIEIEYAMLNLFIVNLQYIFRQHNTLEQMFNATRFDSGESLSGLLLKNR